MGAHVPIPHQQPTAASLIHHMEELDLTHGLMLSSGTSVSIACNKAHVSGIRLAKVPLPVGTDGGPITVPYQAAINALPKLPAWFYDKGVANVICQADIEDHFECDLDFNKVNLTYTVTHLPTGRQIVFHHTPYLHLHMYYPDESEQTMTMKCKLSLINVVVPPTLPAQANTVKGNSVPYSKRQQHDALKPQQLMESVGCPTIVDLKAV